MADEIRLMAVVRDIDNSFRVEDLGMCGRSMGGGYGCVTPQDTELVLDKESARQLSAKLNAWVKGEIVRRCKLCKTELNLPGSLRSQECGGDCLGCMADAGDPDAIEDLKTHG